MAKVFRGKNVQLLYDQLKVFFPLVTVAKPRSSRNASIEAFVVCQNYLPPLGFEPVMLKKVLESKMTLEELTQDHEEEASPSCSHLSTSEVKPKHVVPFVACGDLQGWDSEKSYDPDDDDVWMVRDRKAMLQQQDEGQNTRENIKKTSSLAPLNPCPPQRPQPLLLLFE